LNVLPHSGHNRLRPRRRWLRYVLPGAALVVVLAGGAFAALESDTVDTYWEGLWWALSLTTTVGIVGREPLTTTGHILSASLMLMGFLLLAMTTAAVASLFIREDEEPEERALRIFEEHALAELRELRTRLEQLEARHRES
jgi:voltage-gated potassium channel